MTLIELQTELSEHMAKIAEYFKHPRITLVVRSPELPDGDVVLTDDDLDAAIAAITRLKEHAANYLPGNVGRKP